PAAAPARAPTTNATHQPPRRRTACGASSASGPGGGVASWPASLGGTSVAERSSVGAGRRLSSPNGEGASEAGGRPVVNSILLRLAAPDALSEVRGCRIHQGEHCLLVRLRSDPYSGSAFGRKLRRGLGREAELNRLERRLEEMIPFCAFDIGLCAAPRVMQD